MYNLSKSKYCRGLQCKDILYYDKHNPLEAKDTEDLRVFIDAICISFYKVPLLVALITKDPSQLENDFQVSGLPQELREKVDLLEDYLDHT